MTRSQVDATPLAVTYAAPLFDISGYATMARAVVLGLDELGVQVTAQPLWRAGVPEISRLEAVPAGMSLRPLDCGGERVQIGFHPGPRGEAQRIVLRLGDGTLYEYRTAVDAADVQRILGLGSTGRRVDSPFVLHMIPAHHRRDIYASARALNPGHPYYVGSTMFETDGIPADWAIAANGMDEIWVPTSFNRRTFAAGGVVPEKLHVLPLGVDVRRFDPTRVTPLTLGRGGFTFLSVFQWTRRKGWDVLLRAYLETFKPEDDVRLVLRTYCGTGESAATRLREAVESLGHDPERCADILLLDTAIPDALLPGLYAACDAYVLPTRGEGWGMPYLEAMAMGKPTIATRWGGNLEFMHDENAFLIDIEGLRPVCDEQRRDDPLYDGQHLAEPSVAHTAELLRRVFEDRDERTRRGARARADVEARWTTGHQAERIRARLVEIQRTCDARTRSTPATRGASAPGSHDVGHAPAPAGARVAASRPNAVAAPPSFRALLALHAPESRTGDDLSRYVLRLQARLRALGIAADVATSALPDAREYDVAHVFDVWEPSAALAQLRHFHAQRIPVVFSPIYHELSELAWAERAIPAIFDTATAPDDFASYLEAAADGSLVADDLRRFDRHEIVPGYFAAVRDMVSLADHLIARGRFEIDQLAAAGAPVVPFTLVRNTVDVARFATASPDAFSARYGLRDYVLCVGRLEPRKNQLMLAHALRDSGIPLVLLAATADADYGALVRRNGGSHVHVIDSVPQEGDLLAAAYAGARVFALPSWCEGASLSALEAAAAGTALVLSDRSGEGESFGALATYCDPGDVASIRAAVLAQYRRPPDAARRAELHAHVAAYTVDDAVCATLEAYARAVDHARARLSRPDPIVASATG